MEIYNEDCLKGMKRIADGSVDMILTDLPYSITEFHWDKALDLNDLFKEFRRVVKDRSAIVLFGQEPFSSKVRMSALDIYRYDYIWRKSRVANVMNSHYAPLRVFENIMVFSKGATTNNSQRRMIYNPQGLISHGKKAKSSTLFIHHFGRIKDNRESYVPREYVQEYTNYPNNILEFKSPSKPVHPTQKPVPLLEYLIKTYTDKGEVVLDATFGSGSTAVACVNTNRKFIGFETEEKYFQIAQKRIAEAQEKRAQSLF